MGCAGEVMVGPKKVYLLDEPTTGLDSSTAHQVVRSIRDYAHLEQVPLLYPPLHADHSNNHAASLR